MSDTPTILRVDASMRHAGSVSRHLADRLVDALAAPRAASVIEHLDLAVQTPRYVDETWIAANFTPAESRTEAQRAALVQSDALVAQLERADTVVIATPIYNFAIPGALKAWIDLVCRAGVTFRYTEDGPVGLMTGKTAWLCVASGGTEAGSQIDHATGYLRFVLGFIGITDVELVAADKLMSDPARTAEAEARIDTLAAMRAA